MKSTIQYDRGIIYFKLVVGNSSFVKYFKKIFVSFFESTTMFVHLSNETGKLYMLFIQEVLTYGNEIVQHALDAMNGCGSMNQEAYFFALLGYTNNELNKGMTNKFFEDHPKLKGIPQIKNVV